MKEMEKVVVILRGVSGSGKTAFADLLFEEMFLNNGAVVCTADEYFMKDGEYKFIPEELPKAHEFCFNLFKKHVDLGTTRIIQANTNTKEWEFQKYIDYAKLKGYTVFCLVVENRHGNSDVHNVPDDSKQKQETNLRLSLKLS